VACAFLGWTGFAHALGLGEIESRSRLNQIVAASIPILSAAGGEIDSITVQLASNEDFERAGIERSEFVSALRFTVENDTIRVTSKQIAREPFVGFVLDVRWSGGRLLREYTLLLDPPNLASAGISAPRVTPIGEAVSPDIPESPPDAPPVETADAEPGVEAPLGEMPAETGGAPQPDQPPPPDQPGAMASAEGGMYGPVAPQETLWSIAYKLRPDPATITMDQMQVAIYNANPKAFSGSIRGLMKGSMLRIPSGEEARATDAASAKALVAAAREGGADLASASRPEPTPEPAPIEAPPEPAPSMAEASPPPPTPEAAPPTEAAPPASEAPPPAPVEARPAPAPTPAPETRPTPAPKAAPIIPKGPGLMDSILENARGVFENPMVQYAVAGLIGLIVLVFVGKKAADKMAQMRYNRASQQVEAARTAPAATTGSEDVTQVADQPAPSMQAALDSAGDAPTVVQGQPLASTVAMGSETMQQTMQQTQAQEPPQAATGGRGVDFDVTSNFASETVQINLDAGDPLSEAEFHRAYGLYDEAALMLKQALQKDPNRTDARVKLAEIYFEAGKANEFVEVAKELKGQLPADKWQPIALMGSQIAPSNDLFAGAGAGGGTVDLSFDEPAAAPAAPPAAPAAAAPAGDSLEFDLGSLSLDTAAPAPAAAPEATPAGDALEFDLGGLATETPAEAPAAAPEAAAGDLNLDLGDFDVNAGAAAPAGGEVVELSAEPGMDPAAAPGDEAGTKLDLARAYLDMGDADMAKSLLNEVAQQGNDAQKKEADELLKRASA
jgi:pilus assembly protein FimV